MELLINKNETEGDIQLSIMDSYGRAFCMLNYYENEKHAMFFSNFCVNEDNRSCGLGSIMINEVMKYAKELGCEYLYLEVEISNEWVCDCLSFYCSFISTSTVVNIQEYHQIQ